MAWLKLLFVGGLLVAFSFAGGMVAGSFRSIDEQGDEGFADQFCRAAKSLGNSSSWPIRHKQELLRAAARQCQANQVGASGLYWNEFQKGLPNSAHQQEGLEQETDRLIQLVAFQDQLEESLIRATNVIDFDHAWEVWEQVNRQVFASRDKLLLELSALVGDFAKPTEANSLDDVTGHYVEFADQLKASHIPLSAIIAATPPTEPLPEDLKHAVALIGSWQNKIETVAQETQKAISQHKQQLRESTVKVEPTRIDNSQFADGQFTAWIAQIAKLDFAVERSDLGAWLDLQSAANNVASQSSVTATKTPDALPIENALAASLAGAAQDAGIARQLAYNLWALREIHAAETSESWISRLAQIDTGMLEPVVSALFSSVYSRRLEAVTSPEGRSGTVQQLLSGSKVPLSAF